MFGYACDETPRADADADHVRAPADARAGQGRGAAASCPFLRPDGKSQVSVVYEDGKPVRVDTVVVSTQHDADVSHKKLDARRSSRRSIKKAIPAQADRRARRAILVNPTGPLRGRRAAGRLRPDRPQDHRGHLRRHGPPRRRRLLGQGPLQGGPQRGLHGALRGQEHRGRASWRSAAKCSWPTPSATRSRCPCYVDTFGTGDGRRREDRAGRAQGLRAQAGARSSSSSTCCARSTSRPPPTGTSAGASRRT